MNKKELAILVVGILIGLILDMGIIYLLNVSYALWLIIFILISLVYFFDETLSLLYGKIAKKINPKWLKRLMPKVKRKRGKKQSDLTNPKKEEGHD